MVETKTIIISICINVTSNNFTRPSLQKAKKQPSAAIRELWLCYTGGTRLDSPSSIIMKQPLPGAALTVCKEIRVHRQHSQFLSTRNWFSPLLYSPCRITNYNVVIAIRGRGGGVDVNCLHFQTRWKPRKKMMFPVLTNHSNWGILLLDLLFLFCRLYNYCKIDFSFPIYWRFLSAFFKVIWTCLIS